MSKGCEKKIDIRIVKQYYFNECGKNTVSTAKIYQIFSKAEFGMLKITLVTVGKIKEKYFTDAIDEYSKRLSRYCKLNIVQVPDEKTPDTYSENEKNIILKKEAERIQKKIPCNAHVITLEIDGMTYTSAQFAGRIEKLAANGTNHIVFVIGGSMGLHGNVTGRADGNMSFGKLTFPHQMIRVVLLEQVYRAFKIINNEPYHK